MNVIPQENGCSSARRSRILVQTIHQERISVRIVERVVGEFMPKFLQEFECNQQRTVEQCVCFLLPHIAGALVQLLQIIS